MSKAIVETSTAKFSSHKHPETFVSVFSMNPRRKITRDSSTSALHYPPLQSVTTSKDKHSNFSRCPIPRSTTSSYSSSKLSKNDLLGCNYIGIAETQRTESINDVVGLRSSKQVISTLLDEQPRSQKTPSVHSEYHPQTEPNDDDCPEERESVKSIIFRLESFSKPVDCQPKSTLTKRGMWLNQTANKNKKVINVTSSLRNEYHKTDVSSANVFQERFKPTVTKLKSNSEDGFSRAKVVEDRVKPTSTKLKSNSEDSFSTDKLVEERVKPKNILRSNSEDDIITANVVGDRVKPTLTKLKSNSIDDVTKDKVVGDNLKPKRRKFKPDSEDVFKDYRSLSPRRNDTVCQSEKPLFHQFISSEHSFFEPSANYTSNRGIERTGYTEISKYNKRCDTNNNNESNSANRGYIKHNESIAKAQKAIVSHDVPPSSSEYVTAKRNKTLTPMVQKTFVTHVQLPSSSGYMTVKRNKHPTPIDNEKSFNENTTKSLKAFVSRVTLPSSSEFKTVKGIENLTLIDTENSIRQTEFLPTKEVRDQSENQIQNDRKFTTDIAKDSNQKLIGSLSTLLDNQYLSQSFASFRNRRKHWFQNNKYSGHHDNSNFLEGDYSNHTDNASNDMGLYLGNPSLNKAFHVFRVRRRNSDINSTNKCNMLN